MRKWLCCLSLLLAFTGWSFAEEQILDVSVYKQGLVINGTALNSTVLKHPLLSFKNLVYMPLTTDMGKRVGLKIEWNEAQQAIAMTPQEPLTIAFSGDSYTHGDIVKAVVTSRAVMLNEEALNFGSYPVLVYQDVTYIPLSWGLMNTTLGWKTAHHPYVGLILATNGIGTVEEVLAAYNVRYYEALASFMQTRNRGYSPESALEMVRMVKENADTHGLDEKWILSLWWQESNFNTGSVSGHGALGAMQIMPDTGRRLGYTPEQLMDPRYNVEGGTRYLAGLRNTFSGDLFLATVAYNQGSTRVSRGSYNPRFGYEVQKKFDTINAYVQNYLAQ